MSLCWTSVHFSFCYLCRNTVCDIQVIKFKKKKKKNCKWTVCIINDSSHSLMHEYIAYRSEKNCSHLKASVQRVFPRARLAYFSKTCTQNTALQQHACIFILYALMIHKCFYVLSSFSNFCTFLLKEPQMHLWFYFTS